MIYLRMRQERLKLLKNRGSMKATFYWLIKKAFCIDFYFFYMLDLSQHQYVVSTESKKKNLFQLLSLGTPEEVHAANPTIVDTLGLQCGQGINKLIENKAIIYALIDEQNVVSQVNIQRNTIVQVDTPALLHFQLSVKDTFLGYLFTYEQYRGQGSAPLLLQRVCSDLQRKGVSRIITHIRATNSPSLNTFEKCGWTRSGWMMSTINGRLLKKFLPKKLGISVSTVT